MESFELRIFREAAKIKSISKAAQKLGYVQSNVTAHIKKIESELDTILMIRHSKGITLTEDGEKLLCYADTILSTLDKATLELQRGGRKLRVGAAQTLSASRLPDWLYDFQKKFPDVPISVTTDAQDRLVELLCKRELDCAFVETRHLTEQVKSIFSFDEELCIAAPPKLNKLTFNNNFLVTNKIPTCPYRKMLLEWFASHTDQAPKIIEFDTVEGIIHAISIGMGITLLPYSVISGTKNISLFRSADLGCMNMNMIVLHNQKNKITSDFQALIKDHWLKESGGQTTVFPAKNVPS